MNAQEVSTIPIDPVAYPGSSSAKSLYVFEEQLGSSGSAETLAFVVVRGHALRQPIIYSLGESANVMLITQQIRRREH
jgi:hypothetical protein